MAAVEDIADEPADEDIEEGEGERLQLGHVEKPAGKGDDDGVDSDVAEGDGEQAAEHEEGKGIDTEDEEEFF